MIITGILNVRSIETDFSVVGRFNIWCAGRAAGQRGQVSWMWVGKGESAYINPLIWQSGEPNQNIYFTGKAICSRGCAARHAVCQGWTGVVLIGCRCMPDLVMFYGFGCFGAWVDGGSVSDFTKLDSQSIWTSGKHTTSGNSEPFQWVTGDGVLRIDVDFWDQNQPPPAADMDHFGTWENVAWVYM